MQKLFQNYKQEVALDGPLYAVSRMIHQRNFRLTFVDFIEDKVGDITKCF